jgi:predicted secreted protein
MARFKVQDITISAGSAIGAFTSANIEASVGEVETTGAGDAARSRKAGYKDWTMSGTARYQGSAFSEGQEVAVSFAIPTAQTFAGTGIITRWSAGGDHEAAVDLTFEIKCSNGVGLSAT